jgi:hypothetical protein
VSRFLYRGILPSEGEECFFDIDVGFCRCFDEWDSEFLGEGFALFFGDNAFLGPVAFISDENFVDSLRCMLFDILEPCTDIYVV